jgi:hypothetical protein
MSVALLQVIGLSDPSKVEELAIQHVGTFRKLSLFGAEELIHFVELLVKTTEKAGLKFSNQRPLLQRRRRQKNLGLIYDYGACLGARRRAGQF